MKAMCIRAKSSLYIYLLSSGRTLKKTSCNFLSRFLVYYLYILRVLVEMESGNNNSDDSTPDQVSAQIDPAGQHDVPPKRPRLVDYSSSSHSQLESNDDDVEAKTFGWRSIKHALEHSYEDFSLSPHPCPNVTGIFHRVLFKKFPTNSFKCLTGNCKSVVSLVFDIGRDPHSALAAHQRVHDSRPLIPTEYDEGVLKNLVIYDDPSITLSPFPNVNSHYWINFPRIVVNGQETEYAVCMECCTVIEIDFVCGDVSCDFPRVTLAGHKITCKKDVPVNLPFDGYRKLEIEAKIQDEEKRNVPPGKKTFLMRDKGGRATSNIWKRDASRPNEPPPFQLVFERRVQNGRIRLH